MIIFILKLRASLSLRKTYFLLLWKHDSLPHIHFIDCISQAWARFVISVNIYLYMCHLCVGVCFVLESINSSMFKILFVNVNHGDRLFHGIQLVYFTVVIMSWTENCHYCSCTLYGRAVHLYSVQLILNVELNFSPNQIAVFFENLKVYFILTTKIQVYGNIALSVQNRLDTKMLRVHLFSFFTIRHHGFLFLSGPLAS